MPEHFYLFTSTAFKRFFAFWWHKLTDVQMICSCKLQYYLLLMQHLVASMSWAHNYDAIKLSVLYNVAWGLSVAYYYYYYNHLTASLPGQPG